MTPRHSWTPGDSPRRCPARTIGGGIERFQGTAADIERHQLIPFTVQNLEVAENSSVEITQLIVAQIDLGDMLEEVDLTGHKLPDGIQPERRRKRRAENDEWRHQNMPSLSLSVSFSLVLESFEDCVLLPHEFLNLSTVPQLARSTLAILSSQCTKYIVEVYLKTQFRFIYKESG